MSLDVLRVTSITLQGHDEAIATTLPEGLRLQCLDCSMPLNHRQVLSMTFLSETVEPILHAVEQMLVGAVMTIELTRLHFRGVVIACTADHLDAGMLPADAWGLHESEPTPRLQVTVHVISQIQRA